VENSIQVKSLVKRYKDLMALNHFDIEIRKGELLALLGPNGCGKTTAINCMLGFLTFDSGEVTVLGESKFPLSNKVRREIGIVPQELAYLDNLSVEENIDFFCGLYISDPKQRKQYVQEAIEFVELQEFRKFVPKKLSGGLKRRLNIACGIVHKPSLIFFDEPTVAVDTQSRSFILEGIRKLNEQGSISISARSRSKVNVQKIMEQMGGGGHFNSAASQLEDVTIDQVRTQLIDCIQEEVQKDKEEEE